jgi:hypothetical protein
MSGVNQIQEQNQKIVGLLERQPGAGSAAEDPAAADAAEQQADA